jgi:3-deoxy-7-phosphoheptulonate synthase
MLVQLKAGSERDAAESVKSLARLNGCEATEYRGNGGVSLVITGKTANDLLDDLTALDFVATVTIPKEPGRPETSNLRIERIRPLLPPAILVEQLPLSTSGATFVHDTRRDLQRILTGTDDRLVVVVGPCSVHDVEQGLEYARLLKPVADELARDLQIVMRVYFEKPRTTVGWKGLINDPNLDGTYSVNEGLSLARKLLLDVIDLGLPAGCEFLDPITPQFIADLVTWGAIGARTTESQVHRNLTSGLSMPVGFKNGTGGDIQIAVDAMNAAAHPHQFMSVTEQGVAAIVVTRGNLDTHVILRGGATGPNFDAESVEKSLADLARNGMPQRVMVDASHGNSFKDYRKQPDVVAAVAEQVAAGQRGIIGVMLESFVVDGAQKFTNKGDLVRGQSITDSCMGWEMTVPVLHQLAAAVRSRRSVG